MDHTQTTVAPATTSEEKSPTGYLVGITLIIGGASLGSVALIAIFSPEYIPVTPWIVAGLSAMGVALGYFSQKGIRR